MLSKWQKRRVRPSRRTECRYRKKVRVKTSEPFFHFVEFHCPCICARKDQAPYLANMQNGGWNRRRDVWILSTTPEYCWTIQATLKAAGFSVVPYHFDVIVEHEEDWGYGVAATRPISPADVNILVPNRYLNRDRLKDMFHIRYGYWKYWEEDEIQTDRSRVLAYIQKEDI